ncbi:MAG TPA: hypothetical protein VFU82_08230 [Gammaproteobacteria bacterium]|nr:hypothetical protein [Gammaproteobacteria bacterium]
MSHTRNPVRKPPTDEVESTTQELGASSSDSDSEKNPSNDMIIRATVQPHAESDDEDPDKTLPMEASVSTTPLEETPTEQPAQTTAAEITQQNIELFNTAIALEKARAEAIQSAQKATETSLKAVEDAKTTVMQPTPTQTHAAPEAAAQPKTPAETETHPETYSTVVPETTLSPFQKLDQSLATLELKDKDTDGPNIDKAIFFKNVLKLVEINRESPEKAVKAIEKMVDKAQDDHPHISAMMTSFYKNISCLNELTPDTIIRDYHGYVNNISLSPPTSDFHAYLKNCILAENNNNTFAKLHLYLQENEPTKDKKYQRKFDDFIRLLAVELPEPPKPSESPVQELMKSKYDDEDVKYQAAIYNVTQAITKEYKPGFFSRSLSRSGAFNDLILDLLKKTTSAKLSEHRTYLEVLKAQVDYSPFAKKVNDAIQERLENNAIQAVNAVRLQS